MLASLTVLLVLAAAFGGFARALGWEPAWAAHWRHACGEAAYRVEGLLADFADRLRLRR